MEKNEQAKANEFVISLGYTGQILFFFSAVISVLIGVCASSKRFSNYHSDPKAIYIFFICAAVLFIFFIISRYFNLTLNSKGIRWRAIRWWSVSWDEIDDIKIQNIPLGTAGVFALYAKNTDDMRLLIIKTIQGKRRELRGPLVPGFSQVVSIITTAHENGWEAVNDVQIASPPSVLKSIFNIIGGVFVIGVGLVLSLIGVIYIFDILNIENKGAVGVIGDILIYLLLPLFLFIYFKILAMLKSWFSGS